MLLCKATWWQERELFDAVQAKLADRAVLAIAFLAHAIAISSKITKPLRDFHQKLEE
jgi:hypothetical protein